MEDSLTPVPFPVSTQPPLDGKVVVGAPDGHAVDPVTGLDLTKELEGCSVAQPKKKLGRPQGKLGKRVQVFMELILAGHPTLEAYSLAGYKGQKNAAYVLRSQLKDRLEERLLNDGISREGLKLELKKLLEIPLDIRSAAGISIRDKIKLLQFMEKLTEKETGSKPAITPFLVNITEPKSVEIHEGSK